MQKELWYVYPFVTCCYVNCFKFDVKLHKFGLAYT
jgi:hypothetical protein